VIGPFDLANNKSFFVFCVVVLALMSVLVIFVRRGTTGHFLDALRGSETAAQSVGINPARAKILAFSLSAGIAGIGGGLLATKVGQANPQDYSYFLGFVFVAIVVSTAARTVEGAINAGMAFVILPYILSDWIGLSSSYAFILFGLGAIGYARHPEGTLENGKRRSMAFFERIGQRFRRAKAGGPDGTVAVEVDVREGGPPTPFGAPTRAGAES
jgi:ABC-type branched-subunit amino acid transport system permease subunit